MALNGSVTSSAYSNRSVTLTWSATQNIAGNYSTISWTLKGSGSASSWYNSAPFKVKINGESVFSSSTRIQLSNGTLVGSGEKTIYHNDSGQANLSIYIEAAIYTNAVNCSGSGNWTLDNIPRAAAIKTADNFTDEGNPTITYTNYLGNNVTSLQACISLTGALADVNYRDISKTGSSYTFNLTEEERNVLRNATTTSNSREVWFFVKTVLNGVTYHSTLIKTLTIINATPTFTSSVKDTGAASTTLTGATAGNPSMIKGFNYMDVSMAATAYKGATIKTYKITNGANVINEASGAFNNSINNSFLFEVWDSRGNYNSYTTTIPMINYIPLTINADNAKILLDEADNTKARIEVELHGNYFNNSFGATTNSLSIDYSLEGDDGSKLTGVVEIPAAAFDGNTFTISFALDNLDYRNGYIVYFGAIDKVTPKVTVATKTLKAIPIFDWGENDFNFNVDVTIKGQSIDYVTSQGEAAGWHYRIWSSGIAELWTVTEPTDFTINTNWGGWYVKDNAFPSYAFPFEFEEIPCTTFTPTATSGNFWIYTNSGSGNSTTATQAVGVMRPTTYEVTDARLHINVKGIFKRWI